MSLGYAEKLSYRDDLGGQLGAPECFDSPEEVDRKVTLLAQLVTDSKKICAFTGAGISTSCGIPDFRGPQGIWTLQRAGKPLPRPKVSFEVAKPSFTHASLVALMNTGKLTYIVSQNVDGLHLRSGIPRHKLAELHGNVFSERCVKCKKEYIRDFEVETVGFKKTGRMCTEEECYGNLHDHVLDWEDALPVDELNLSEKHSREADLAICLGTSLQITPACNLPLKAIKKYKNKDTPGKLVIINLQRTQHDKKAEASGGLVIRARTDDVMRLLVSKLTLPVPRYIRKDAVVIRHYFKLSGPNEEEIGGIAELKLLVMSVHGMMCAIPAVTKVEFEFPGGQTVVSEQAPFRAICPIPQVGVYPVRIKFHLHPESDEEMVVMTHTARLEELKERFVYPLTFEFQTQAVEWEFQTLAEGRHQQQQQQQQQQDDDASEQEVKKRRVA